MVARYDPGSGKVPDHYDVYLYPNDFPAFSPEYEPFDGAHSADLFGTTGARGACDVVIYHPDHNLPPSQLSAEQKGQLVAFLQQLDDGALRPVGLARRAPVANTGRMRLERLGASLRIGWEGLGESARVALLDSRGRRVWSAQGQRGMIWNGKDAAGAKVPAGVYQITATGARQRLAR